MKKYLLFLVLIISSFMIYNQNVFAYTVDSYELNRSFNVSSGNNYSLVLNNNFYKQGNGHIFFTITTWPSSLGTAYNRPLLGATAVRTGDFNHYECSIGDNFIYEDNTTLHTIYSISCPIDLTNDALYAIDLKFNQSISNSNLAVKTSQYVTFVESSSADVVEAIQGLNMNSALNNINNNTAQTANNTAEINNSINNDNVDSASSSATTWNSKNTSNGVVTQLLTLPINLLTAIVNGIQTSCSSFTLGSLFDTNIELPCINISSYIGSGLFTTIDLLISGFMIYNISKKLIKIFNDFTNLKSNQIDEIYGGGAN